MKTAVLYNPQAGKGLPAEAVMERLLDFFPEDELVVTRGELLIRQAPIRLAAIHPDEENYLGILTARVKALAEVGAERFVCVGGDGTATYTANILDQMNCRFPIMGVAAGTANVGPVISMSLEQMAGKTAADLREVSFDGIEVRQQGKFLSLAFNDVVIGDTFLATCEGKTCNASVASLLNGQGIVPKSPSQDLIPDIFYVEKNGKRLWPKPGPVRQIIVSSTANESHYGRAIYGPLCNSHWTGKKGVVALCDHVAVSMDAGDAGIEGFSSMQYLLFDEKDLVFLEGLAPGAFAICDGNPYFITDKSLELRYRPAAVRTLLL